MSLKSIIYVIVAFAILGSFLLPGVSYSLFRDFDERYTESMTRSINDFVALSDFNMALIRYDNAVLRYLSSGEQMRENYDWFHSEVDTAKKKLDDNLTYLKGAYDNDQKMMTVLLELEKKQVDYINEVEAVVNFGVSKDNKSKPKSLSASSRAEKLKKLTKNYNTLVRIYNQVRILVEERQASLSNTIYILDQKLSILRNWSFVSLGVIFSLLLIQVIIIQSVFGKIAKIISTVKEVRADKLQTLSQMIDTLEPYVKENKGNNEIANLARTLRFLGLEVREKTKELSDLVITDEKTKLFNYRHFKSEFQNEAMYAKRFGDKISLVMLDVDKFKHYNDTNGHLAGDDCLILVASLLKSCVRETDLPARFGGEEFAVMLPRTNKEQALMQAERIRKAIDETYFPNQEKQPTGNLTASLGIATFPDDGEDLKELTEAADLALYQAKERGRNCVVAFTTDMVPEKKS